MSRRSKLLRSSNGSCPGSREGSNHHVSLRDPQAGTIRRLVTRGFLFLGGLQVRYKICPPGRGKEKDVLMTFLSLTRSSFGVSSRHQPSFSP